VERERRECHALELVHGEAERLDHAVDLAMLTLVDRDAEPRVLGLAGKDFDLGGHRDLTVVECDAFAEQLDVTRVELAVDLDVIGLGHVAARREQLGRELAVVREEQDALGVEVEAPDGLHRHGTVREVVHHRGATAVVGDGRDARLGLVQQDVELVESDDGFAIDEHLVHVRVDLGAEDFDHLAVHGHATGGDEVFGFAARRHTSGR
jgi:hypothetical protein